MANIPVFCKRMQLLFCLRVNRHSWRSELEQRDPQFETTRDHQHVADERTTARHPAERLARRREVVSESERASEYSVVDLRFRLAIR